MAKKDFLKTKFVKKLMLFNVFDIDEFVLNEVDKIKKSNNLDVFEVSNAKRYSYELCRVGENEMQKDEISTEDYLYRKENFDDPLCFSELNYIEFENEFPTHEIYDFHINEWLYDFHYNKGFFLAVKKWIDNTEGDASKKIRIRDVFNLLRRSNFALKNIETNWNKIKPIHEIQKAVIDIHINFTDLMIESIMKYYNYVFPNFLKINDKNMDLPNYQIEIGDDAIFNLEIADEALDFLIYITNKEKFYLLNVSSIIYQTKGITLEEYIKENNDKNLFSISMLDLAEFFEIYTTKEQLDNIFYNYLLTTNKSDLIKKQKIKNLLVGVKKYMDYQWENECVSQISYHYHKGLESINNNNRKAEFHDTLKSNNLLNFFTPHYWVFINLKAIYDIIWDDYSLFIDKETENFQYFYSNKEKPKIKIENKLKIDNDNKTSRNVPLNYLCNGIKQQELFENYEKELFGFGFINEDKNQWLKNASTFIRFYNYCERNEIFKENFEDSKDGVNILRKLYNFYDSNDLDTPSKRKIQENKKNKHQYIFLDKFITCKYKFQ